MTYIHIHIYRPWHGYTHEPINFLFSRSLSAHSALFPVAACAAQHGLHAIPREWADKTTMYDELEELTDSLLED